MKGKKKPKPPKIELSLFTTLPKQENKFDTDQRYIVLKYNDCYILGQLIYWKTTDSYRNKRKQSNYFYEGRNWAKETNIMKSVLQQQSEYARNIDAKIHNQRGDNKSAKIYYLIDGEWCLQWK